jgi:apolipoprotein N-acyltransferase
MSDRDGRLPPAVALVLALVSGVALDLAFPDPGWWMLAALGIAGLTLAVRGVSTRWAALLGLVAGLGCFVPLLHWSGVYVGALPWLALAVSQACFVALVGAGLAWAWRVPGGRAGTVLAVAGLWVLGEGLRARLPFGGFPWGRLAFSQSDAPALGWAAVGGAPLVSAVVAAAGACLAVAVADLLRRRAGFPARAAVCAAVAVGLVAAGPLALTLGNVGSGGTSRDVRVAAVQGDVPKAGLDFNAQRRAVLDNHVRATLALADAVRAGRTPAPDLVVWPENASDIDPLRNLDAYAEIGRATDAVGVPLLVGAVLEGPGDHVSNAGIVWGPTGSASAGPGERYIKRHPVPFGEYIPYRSFFRIFSSDVDLVSRDFAAGNRAGVLQVGPARVGDVICFEVAYDDILHDVVAGGADLLVVQTNNATFGYTDESVQQIAMSRLRAVEAGRAVVQVSTVGVSGLVEPDGHVVAGSGLFTPAVLESTLPLRTGFTVATRMGVLPEAALAAAGALLVGLAVLRSRRQGAVAQGAADAEVPEPAEPAVSGGAG